MSESRPLEASCRLLSLVFPALERQGVDPDELFDGLAFPVSHLRDTSRWIDWATARELLQRAEDSLGEGMAYTAGLTSFNSPVLRFARPALRSLFSARSAYVWAFGPTGMFSRYYTCFASEVRDVGSGVLEIEVRMKPGYEVSPAFQSAVHGQIVAMPEVMGLSGAGVTHSVLPDGSLFTVQLPVERMGWRRLFGVIRNRFSAAGELREAHGLTQVKLRELEAEVRRRERVEAELRAEIEERLQVEARGADLEQELQQARRLESIGLLAGGVAHDFNNLLVAILGNAELLLKRDLDAYGRECVGEISQAAERAAEITGQLLAFGRRQVLQPVPLDVVKVLEDMQGLLRRLLPESVTLDIHAQDQVGAINADRSQVEQVVMNLCVNARDAMPDGGTLAVEIEEVEIGAEYAQAHVWARAGRFVMLRVSDTGVGMSPELLGQIFDPFFTTKPEGSGTGLGLSVVLGVISQHKGFMHPYSELGIGTSMKVYLPLADVDVSPAPPREAPSATRGGDETILVVEDDPLVRSLAGRVLSEAGYSVLTASSGDEGIAVFTERAAQVDLLLLDVVLPGCSGREVHDAAVILRPNVTVLYTSGYSPRGIHTGFVLDEGLELLPKPYAPAELLRRVRCLLDASTAGATVPAS